MKAKELLPEKEAKISTMEQEIKTLRNQLKETNQLKEVYKLRAGDLRFNAP